MQALFFMGKKVVIVLAAKFRCQLSLVARLFVCTVNPLAGTKWSICPSPCMLVDRGSLVSSAWTKMGTV